MKYIEKFNERFHVNQDNRHLTNLIYNKIYQLIPKLITHKKIEISNFLKDNYTKLKFENDKIVLRLSKTPHAYVINKTVENDIIQDTILVFGIKLSNDEITQKKLINNSVREDINHEIQHLIEFYHSYGNPSKSWDFHKRLKKHEEKFNNNEKWLNLCYLFYLTEDHELRSRVSQSLELLKNGNDLKSSKLYKDIDFLSNISVPKIISNVDTKIVDDFVESVLLKKGDSMKTFTKYLNIIKRKSQKYKIKMLRVLYFYENPDSSIDEHIDYDRNIDYSEYIEKGDI